MSYAQAVHSNLALNARMCDKATNVHDIPTGFISRKQVATASEITPYLETLGELTGGKN
jgi:hypothetical protein